MTAYTYTVQPGDTLSGIAEQTCGDATLYLALAALNNIPNPDLIAAGSQIIIDCDALHTWSGGTPVLPGYMPTPDPTSPLSGFPILPGIPTQPPPAPTDPALTPGPTSLPGGIPPLPGSGR